MAATRWKLFVDGASRNNPGPSGAGIYLMRDDEPVIKQGYYLGIKTNNQAEYCALLIGLHLAQRHCAPGDFLAIFCDSQLMVRQVEGSYRVSSPGIAPLHKSVMQALSHFSYEIRHVLRDDNAIADKLANLGIDKKLPVPHELQPLCGCAV